MFERGGSCRGDGGGAAPIAGDVDVDRCPMADGGEGTVEALVMATGGRFVFRRVTGPIPDMKVEARFGVLGDGQTAVIEMAAASGLAMLEARRTRSDAHDDVRNG